jgi:hypothetical protein
LNGFLSTTDNQWSKSHSGRGSTLSEHNFSILNCAETIIYDPVLETAGWLTGSWGIASKAKCPMRIVDQVALQKLALHPQRYVLVNSPLRISNRPRPFQVYLAHLSHDCMLFGPL